MASRYILLLVVFGCSNAFKIGDYAILPPVPLHSSFVGIGLGQPEASNDTDDALNANRKFCNTRLTPKGDCKLRSTEGLYGRWYVVSEPGIPNSPVCEKVDFYPETNQHNFLKNLQIKLQNGTWFEQKQNGTLTGPGKILLELDLLSNGLPKTPRRQLGYSLIDYDPDNYITAFFCRRGHPTVPVLLRSPNPTPAIWAKIFAGVIRVGLSLSNMDLFCQPSPQRPPPTSEILHHAPVTPTLPSSINPNEVYY